MPTRDETATLLFQRGEYLQLLREFSDVVKLSAAGSAGTRLLVGHALAITGDLPNAERIAYSVLSERLPSSSHSRARLVLGLAGERAGQVDHALKEYEQAHSLVTERDDPILASWIQLHRFRLYVEGHSMKALTAMIPSLRRLVSRSGDSQLTAYLHMCIAVLEGETGHLDEARRHTDVAESLLEVSDNHSLRSANLVNRGCLAILNGNLKEAASAFNLAKGLTRRTGDPFIASRVDGNLAHIQLFSGEIDDARSLFEQTLSDRTLGKLGEVGALDGLARVHLTAGNADACAACLSEIDSYRTNYEAHTSMYHVRWAGLTKARLLLRKRQFDTCADLLAKLAHETAAVNDRPFAVALEQLAALADSGLGNISRSAHHLLAADQTGALSNRELQPQHYFVAGQVIERHDRSLARQLRHRANRVWASQGLVSMRVELDDQGIDLDSAKRELKIAQTTAPPPPRTIETISNAWAAAMDLAHSPRLFGIELLSLLRGLSCCPGASVVESRENAPVDSPQQLTVALGADGSKQLTLVCPIPNEPVKAVVLGDVVRLAKAALTLDNARREDSTRSALWPASPAEEQAGAIFVAEEMRDLLSMVRRVAPTNTPVLITGETGTGKEVVARILHGYSNRSKKPFIPFNCSATPKDMLDAQLFGHRRGAFTGATENFSGVIRAAAGGTLFLDEIGETTLDLQPKLLRFLESGEVHPIGETAPTHVNVRVVAATNADLDTLIAEGRFRSDLYYRLNIITLHLPPLRARREEIPLLAQHYLDRFSIEAGKQGLRLAEDTVEYLLLYKWPGNVRQLANEMRRMSALADDRAVLMPEHLSPAIAASRRTVPPSERVGDPNEVTVRLDQPVHTATAHLERAMIQHAMKKCNGRVEETARVLGLSRKGLYLKRQRLGLDTSDDTTT